MKPQEKICKAYYETKSNQLYFNQLKELTDLSNSSLQNSLKQMLENNLIELNKTKSNTYYKIKDKKIFALEFSKIAIKNFRALNRGVKIPLEEFLNNISNNIHTIVLFGSASKRQEKANSDIDILIVSNNDIDFKKAKHKAETISNYPLNIFGCNLEDFIINQDHLINQAKGTGFPIANEQNFYQVILDGYK